MFCCIGPKHIDNKWNDINIGYFLNLYSRIIRAGRYELKSKPRLIEDIRLILFTEWLFDFKCNFSSSLFTKGIVL